VRRDGRAGELRRVWTSRPADGPDGIALARSGRIYVALSIGNALAVVSPDGREVARFPATPEANARLAVPFDGPASLAFLGRRLLVTNQSPLRSNPASWALFDVWAGEAGVPLFHPVVAPAARRPRIKLSVTPRSVPLGTRRRLTFLATVGRGTRRRAIAGAKIVFAGRTLRTNRKGRATLRVALTGPRVVRALATATGLRAGRTVVQISSAPRLPR
jgi:hypothetical protein